MARIKNKDAAILALLILPIIGIMALLKEVSALLKWAFECIGKWINRDSIRQALIDDQVRELARQKRVKDHLVNVIEQHIATLARKKKQLSIADEYGVVDSTPWLNEIERFHVSVLQPQVLNPNEASLPDNVLPLVIEELLEKHSAETTPIQTEFSAAMNPYDYERYCAEILSSAGWSARATKGSGDQGSDVIAENNGLKIVLQCKLYTQPVGNKAVQEIFAAKTHEQAAYAAVVTNQSFTRSARQIASTTEVALLHHDQLQEWARGLLPENVQTNLSSELKHV